MPNEYVLTASDRRSPFYINVPSHEAKPITHLVAYFKLWKHFVAALIAYLKDLILAKEFESNLNLQLVGSIQFPGFRDVPFKSLSDLEQQLPSPTSSQAATPKQEPTKHLGAHLATHLATHLGPAASADSKRPNLQKTKSASSFLKNQTFAHRKSNSFSSLKTEPSAPATQSTSPSAVSLQAAKIAPKADVALDPSYFPPDSLFCNTANALVNNHTNAYSSQAKLCREVSHKLLPKLESLHKNLGIKIKEIRSSLKNDSFANNALVKEVSRTGISLNNYVSAINRFSAQVPIMRNKDGVEDDDDALMADPFLVKLELDYQLKNQLIHENYIFASYVNLQNISKDLFNYVIKDLNSVTEKLIKIMSAEAVYATSFENGLVNLGVTLRSKLKTPDHDWQYFIAHNPNFLNVYYDTENSSKKETRSFKDVVVPLSESVHGKCLRSGYMYRKQKVMKSYVSYFYLLTCNFLHEFKIEASAEKKQSSAASTVSKKKNKGKIGGVIDHENTPIRSFNLNDHSIQVKSDKDFKFVLTKTSNSSHKFTFKCRDEESFKNWSTDLHDLLKFSHNHLKRFRFIEEKIAKRDRLAAEAKAKEPNQDLNLGSLLGNNKLNLDKIQSGSLSGVFTPKVESPSHHDKNPFENTLKEGLETGQPLAVFASPTDKGSTSPSVKSPGSESSYVESGSHADEHEVYLQMQNELMAQQQKLVQMQQTQLTKPPLSRNSSSESILSALEQNNANISQFLDRNQRLVESIGDHPSPGNESVSSIPMVYVSAHESE